MNPSNFPRRKEAKRASAAARAEAYAKLTPQQKLARLDAAFGVGLGAKRERARLAKPIVAPATTPTPVQEEKK